MSLRGEAVRLGATAACVLLAAGLPAQVQWTDVGPSPVLNTGWGAAYDPHRDRIVVFGRLETWEYDGNVWSQVQPGTVPLLPGIMTYDPGRRRTLLYTGSAVTGTETWEWDGQDWSLRNAPGPPVGGPALVYHAGRGRVMMFGGGGLNGPSNDLWEWDGVSWQQVPAANPPPVSMPPATSIRYNTLAYAQDRDVLTVFGASTSSGMIGGTLAVTWEWDATNGWRQVNAGGPAYGIRRMTYDLRRRSLVVVLSNVVEAWEWMGTGFWQRRASTAPPPGAFASSLLVYDSRRGRHVLLTNGRTLVYEPVTPATYAPHGTGCPGSLGLPTLRTTAPWTLAWLGDTLSVTVDNLPTSSAVLGIGFDDQSFGGRMLPLHLWPGLPFQCFLRIAPAATTLLMGSGNRASHSLPIPNQGSLLGLTFYQQALAFDPLTRGGAVMSYSAIGTVGAR